MFDFGYTELMNEEIINESILISLREAIGQDSMEDFIRRFFDDCTERTAKITEAYERSKFSEVELEAHTLGSSAATYGAFKLEELCREIEHAKPIKDQVFQDRIDALNRLSEQSVKALQDYIS